MKILQGGAPKCGNFWLYQIIEQILAKTGKNTTSFIEQHPVYDLAKDWDLNYPSQASIDVLEITDLQSSYRISSIFQMPIEDMEAYLNKTNHVWTHSPICKRSAEVFNFFHKKVYIVRDPRDRAISAARYYCSDYMLKYFPQKETEPEKYLEKNFEALMREWVWHVYDHIRLRKQLDIHIVFFENFRIEFQEELGKLLNYLNLSLDQTARLELEKAVSFSTLKRENPRHLKNGKAGYWRDVLSEEQKEKAGIIAGPLIDFLNYPQTDKDLVKRAKIKTDIDLKILKQQILESQSLLYN